MTETPNAPQTSDAAPSEESPTITNLTDATFAEEIAATSEPVLVDFWAEWCGPCKAIAPVLAELAQDQVGTLRVTKLNVDENPGTTRQFEVMGIPTLIVFKDGEPVKRLLGAKPKRQLLQELAPFLA